MRFSKSCILIAALGAGCSEKVGRDDGASALRSVPDQVVALGKAQPRLSGAALPALKPSARLLEEAARRPRPAPQEPEVPETPEAPEAPEPAEFCPPYVESPLFRQRDRQVVVGPGDDWVGAIQNARTGTEVLLRDGEYRLGRVRRVQVGSGVTVRGQSGDRERVVVRGEGYGPEAEGFYITGRDVTIADLSVTRVRSFAISIKGELGAQAPHLYNLHLTDTGKQHIKMSPGESRDGVIACSSIGYSPGAVSGDYIDAIDLHNAIDWVIRDNYIYNITGEHNGCNVDTDCGTYVSGPAILVWNHSRGTIIERNTIVDSYRAIALGLGNHHEGGIVRNNFIWRTEGGDSGVELRTANNAVVANNTIIHGGNRGPIEVSRGHGHRIYNNLLSAPIRDRGDASWDEGGNITDATVDDLAAPREPYLAPGSRAVEAGVPVAEVETDFEGEPRSGRPDVGADEASAAR